MTSTYAYAEDLAYVHDEGFGHVARNAAAELVKQLHAIRIREGLVVDLGCGTGILAEQLAKAGFDVLGFDISEAALKIARQRAPRRHFATNRSCEPKSPSAWPSRPWARSSIIYSIRRTTTRRSPRSSNACITRLCRAVTSCLIWRRWAAHRHQSPREPISKVRIGCAQLAHKKIAGPGFSRARLRPFARSESCIGGVKRHTGSGLSAHIRCFPSCATPVLSSVCFPLTAIYH